MLKNLSVFILAFLIFLPFSVFASEYAIIIDAGSSGSRLHIYQYENDSSVPYITDVFSEKITPGLSSFANRPQKAAKHLQKILTHSLNYLHRQNIDPKKVPISVLATAGMRLVPEDQQAEIYAALRKIIKKYYPYQIHSIRTISGKMEGIYAWMDVNYLAGNLSVHNELNANNKLKKAFPFAGAIDVGGASTQISFPTEYEKDAHTVPIVINGSSHKIFSKSFLGLGIDQARQSINQSQNASFCYPNHYVMNDGTTGQYDFARCSQLYKELINQYRISEHLQPIQKNHFIAFSGVYHGYKFLNVIDQPDENNVMKRIQNVCAYAWEDLKKQHPQEPEKQLANYCANATYLYNLLYETYQLKGKQMTITKDINHQDIDWALGALLFDIINQKQDKPLLV